MSHAFKHLHFSREWHPLCTWGEQEVLMTRTLVLAYWTVAAVAVIRIIGHSEGPAGPECSMKRTEYRIAILGVEWVKSVRETPMTFLDCPAGRRDGGTAGGAQ